MTPQHAVDDMHPTHDTDDPGAELAQGPRGSTYTLRMRGETITARLAHADTTWRRMRGLLGRSGLASDEGLWIQPCNSIHMFGMRFPLDAVFLDRSGQVVRVHEDLHPWRMARGGKFAHSVLELPQGTAAFFNIRAGDRVEIVAEAPANA